MSFKDLDDKYVPRIATVLDRVAKLLPTAPEPTGPLPVIVRLRRLDDRLATRGPLALLREVPQLGAVLIGMLVLVSAITVRARTDTTEPARQDTADDGSVEPSPDQPDDGTLGPAIGDAVAAYVATTKARLRRVAPAQPDGTVMAVVMFTEYLTPEEVRDLVGMLQVRQVLYRAGAIALPNGTPRVADVQDPVADAREAFESVAAELVKDARDNRQVAETTENDPEFKRDYERDAELWEREARVLRGTCACVYGAVVRGRLRLLVDLLNLPRVRTIDVSAVDALFEDLTYTALLPEERKTVTGGNQES